MVKKEKEQKTTINNWGLGEAVRYIDFRWIMKWFIALIVITSLLSLIAFPVKIYSDMDCNSGDIDLNVSSERNIEEDEMQMQKFDLNGIDGMNCKAKIRVDIPLIGLLFV